MRFNFKVGDRVTWNSELSAWTTSAVGSLPNRSLAHLEPVSDTPKRKLENGEQRQPL
jgi:hypothetical protein